MAGKPQKPGRSKPPREGVVARKPSIEVSDAVLDECIEQLAAGRTLSDFCREPGRPDRRSIVRAIAREPRRQLEFTAARACGYDQIAEETLRLVDEPIPKDSAGRSDMAIVQQRRLQAETRLKLLSKWHTAVYGDRVHTTLAGDPQNPIKLDLTKQERVQRLVALVAVAKTRRDNGEPAQINGNGAAQPLLALPAPSTPSAVTPPSEPLVLGVIAHSAIERAQRRWHRNATLPEMDSIGVVPGPQGTVVVAVRHGQWLDEPWTVDEGQEAVRRVHEATRDRAVVHVDARLESLARQLDDRGAQVAVVNLKGEGHERVVARLRDALARDAVDLPPDPRLRSEDVMLLACALSMTVTAKPLPIEPHLLPPRPRNFDPYASLDLLR